MHYPPSLTILNKTILPFSLKKPWKREENPKKCVTLWGRLTASTRQNMPCGSYLSSKNNDLPSFSAAQEPTSSTSKKRRIKKDNHLIVNRFISDQPANSGSTSIFHTPHQRWLFDRVKGQQLLFFWCFLPRNARKTPPRTYLKDPPKRSLPTSPRAKNLLWPHRRGHNRSRSLTPKNSFHRPL